MADPARGEGLRVRFTRIRGETHPASLKRGPLYLPAALGDFEFSEDATHREYETISAGQFSQPRGGRGGNARNLRSLDVDALTVEWDADWIVDNNGGMEPEEVYEELAKLLRYRRAVHMLAILRLGHGRPELNMDVTLRSISRQLRHGQTGIRYYVLRFVEWRDPKLARRAAGSEQGSKGKKLPTTHKLRANDTLHSLSKLYYDSYAGWKAIARENGIRGWGQHSALVNMRKYKVGDRIKIPRKPPIASTNPPPRRVRN